ncbi:MAG: magnesium and cobalt transport protein CorA [Thermoleophilia bacterium]|nr:magnesium and cobalt transport protein CorA [Thermoleophilia bacterium]
MGHDLMLTVLDTFDAERVTELRAAGTFFWLDLVDPSDEQLGQLSSCIGIHELALEDAQKFGQRPKLDEYGDYVALVYFGITDVGSIRTKARMMELHMFVHGDYIITVHREPWPDFERLRATFGRVPLGSEQLVVYRILDALTDSWFPLVERIDFDIEQLEQAVVADPEPRHIEQVMRLKRDLAYLRRTAGPVRDVAFALSTRLTEIPGLEHGPRDYFRDVHDHMIRIDRSLETSRVLLSDVMSVHGARVAQAQNRATERLSIVSTIFLPLSFVVGFFGQNFRWMVDNVDTRTDFLWYGIGGLVVSLLLLAPVIWRSRSDE